MTEWQEFDAACPENCQQIASFLGRRFWTGSYFVSTVYVHEKVARAYIENPEIENPGLGNLFDRS